MNWTQPICSECYAEMYPGRDPARLRYPDATTCCMCGRTTREGIYVRVDPRTVPHPTDDDG